MISPSLKSASAITLEPGFPDPVLDAQAVFRAILQATAYPGRIISLGKDYPAPRPLAAATAAVCLTLVDVDTPTWLDRQTASSATAAWLRFHCAPPLVPEAATARFALITDAAQMPRLFEFHPGDIEYPERSATIIVQVPSLISGASKSWSGPGIETNFAVGIDGLPFWFWSDRDMNSELYPRGVDVIFTSGNSMVALPRTTLVEV